MSGSAQPVVRVGIGYLDGSVRTPDPSEVAGIMGERFGRGSDIAPVGFYGRRLGFDGARAGVSWQGRSNAEGTVRVEVTQTALDGLGLLGSVSLMRDLARIGYRPSRLDQWVDDPGRRMTPARVRAAVLAGQVVTHARLGVDMFNDETGRETYYVGQPSSDRRVRCYDRPEGECRYELQARRAAARHGAVVLLKADDPLPAVVSNVLAFADYRESKGRSDGKRADRLAWWSDVVGDLGRAEPAPAEPKPSIDERAAYFRYAWAPSLAEMVDALGRAWLFDVLREGRDRLGAELTESEGVA